MTSDDIPSMVVYGFDPNSISGLISLIIAVVLPLAVGLITTRTTSPAVKAVLLLAFAAVKAFLEGWLAARNSHVDFAFVPVAISTVVNLMIGVAVHFGFFKPTGVTAAAQNTLVKDRS